MLRYRPRPARSRSTPATVLVGMVGARPVLEVVVVVTAVVLIKAAVDRIPEVAEAIAALEGVTEVYSVTGEVDLVAMVRVRQPRAAR